MRKVKEPIPTKREIRRAGKGLHIGYLRVSAVDQNELRQLEGLKLDRTFTDKTSGKDTKRPNLNTVHLRIWIVFEISTAGSAFRLRRRIGKLLILRFTPRKLRRLRLDATRSWRISFNTV